MELPKRVFKNSVVYWLGQLINKLLIFFLMILIARNLGVTEFGKYSLITTIVAFFSLFTDAGLGVLTFREVSRNKDLASFYYSYSIIIKLILTVISLLLIAGFVKTIGYEHTIFILILIYSVTLFTKAFSTSSDSIYNAYEDMEYVSFFAVLTNFLIFIGCFLLIDYGLFYIFVLISLTHLIMAILSFFFTTKRYVKFDFKFNLTSSINLLRNSLPLMLIAVLGLLYFKIDVIMLSKIKTEVDVGIYSAAFRLIEGLLIIPCGLIGALFPLFSRYWQTSLESLKLTYQYAVKYLSLIGLALAVGTTILADKIIHLFYGVNYLSSVTPLRILIWALVLIYINGVFLYLLIASNQQRKVSFVQGICVLLNIIFNFVLIPPLGYIGASIATFISQLIAIIIFGTFVFRSLFHPDLLTILKKPILVTIVLGIGVYVIKDMNIAIIILVSMIIYGLSLHLFRIFAKPEKEFLLSLFQKKEPVLS